MAAMMTPCSTAILAKKGILQILHLLLRDFQKRFHKKVIRTNGGLHLKETWKLH